MAEIEPLWVFNATDKKLMAYWISERIGSATVIRHEFPWLSDRGLAIKGSTSSLLIEKFPRQVPISGLVQLGLAYGSGLHGPILKEPQCGNIGKRIESTLNCESPLVWPQTAKTHGRF